MAASYNVARHFIGFTHSHDSIHINRNVHYGNENMFTVCILPLDAFQDFSTTLVMQTSSTCLPAFLKGFHECLLLLPELPLLF